MSGFKHKNGSQPALKDDFQFAWTQGMEPEEMAQYVDGETINKVIASSGISLKELPRAGVSIYDFEFQKKRPHPAKQKTYLLESARRMNDFIRKHERPAKKQPWKIPRKSLHWLAVELGKSARQVRRYCELGLVPGAYRTKGGHWRVRSGRRALVMVRRKIRGLTRKSWSRSERRFFRERADTDTIRRQMSIAKNLHETAGFNPQIAMKAAKFHEFQTRLILAANQIVRADETLTATGIAVRLGISRASLYRYYSTSDIQAAIRTAREPAMKANFEDDY